MLGETTAGTNGDVTSFTTLGGIRVRFTGLRMINPDGTSTQGTGFAPDIVVHPTLTGVIAGRDEILDAAVQYLRGRH